MLNSLPISRKLGGAFLLVILAAALALGYIYVTAASISDHARLADRYDREQALAGRVEKALLSAVSDIRGFAAKGDVAAIAGYQADMRDFEAAAGELEKLLAGQSDAALLARTRAAAAAWQRQVVQPVLSRLSAAQAEEARALLASGRRDASVEALVAGAEALREEKARDVEAGLDEMQAESLHEEVAVVLGGLLTLGIAVLLWAMLCRSVGRPVVRMTGVMRDLASGNNAVAVPDVARGDELGDMARAVIVFRDTAVAKEAADRAALKAQAEQRQVVDALADGLCALSRGDLTADIRETFPADYALVRENFNSALAALRDLVGNVHESARSIERSSAEVAAASDELSRRSQGTAASLEEATGAITQIDSRLRDGNAAASETASRAADANGAVGEGKRVADEALDAMGRVSACADGIDAVIEGLDKIAFQTRVLAMNAAVEAGRAGEAGRGFAVVADLVSALAMRAEEEAKRARTQLVTTQDEIGSAVVAVRAVDAALGAIAEGVAGVDTLVAGLATDHAAHSHAVSEITAAIGQMDRATQQNAAMIEETSAAAQHLATESRTLVAQANRFTIGGGKAASGVSPRHAPALLH